MRNTLERSKPLSAHSHVVTREGITVAVRTYEVTLAEQSRYEVFLEGSGLTAVLDLRCSEDLDQRIQQAISVFFACVRLRRSQQQSPPV